MDHFLYECPDLNDIILHFHHRNWLEKIYFLVKYMFPSIFLSPNLLSNLHIFMETNFLNEKRDENLLKSNGRSDEISFRSMLKYKVLAI